MTRDQKVALPLILGIFALPLVLVLVQRSRANHIGYQGQCSTCGSQGNSRARISYEPELTTAAENTERWQLIRNDKGRLEEIVVKRTVKGR